MLHFIRDIFRHKSLRMSKALYAGLSTVPPLTWMYYATEDRERRKKNKTDLCPDVGQNRHVFAFMFWNLHCKVATLVQGISHITLPNLLNSATFCLSVPPPFFSLISLLAPHSTYLSLFFTYLYPTLTCLLPIFPNRTTPVIQALARGSMLSITTAHPTLHPTWQVTTPAPARRPPPPPTPFRSHPLASPARPSQRTLQVGVKPQAAGLTCVTWISGVWSC